MKLIIWFGLLATAAVSLVSGQQKYSDPFNPNHWKQGEGIAGKPKTWEVVCEVFSLPLNEAAALRRRNKGAGETYVELLKRVETKSAVLEEFVVMKTLAGAEAEAASVEEYIFPTEYDSPRLPNQIGNSLPEKDASGLSTPSNPTSYDLRELGWTMNLEVVPKPIPETIGLEFEINRVTLVGLDLWGKELAEAYVPGFQAQGFKKAMTLKDGQRVMVGSMSPPRKMEEVERRVWLVFAKATAVRMEENDIGGGKPGDDAILNANCEVFSMTLAEAAKLKRSGESDLKTYAAVVKGLDTKGVALEEFLTMQVVAGDSAVLKEVREMIYATEYDPPYVPRSVRDLSNRPEVTKRLITPASPTAFETKEVGSQMRVALALEEGGQMNLRSNLELVRYLGRNRWGKGPAEAEMPRFTSQRLISRVNINLNSTMLLGSISPPETLQPKEGARRVWFVFLTVAESIE